MTIKESEGILLRRLSAELKNIPAESKLSYIKERMELVGTQEERDSIESVYLFLHGAGFAYEINSSAIAVIHGIRTDAVWQSKLRKTVKKIDNEAEVGLIKYGYFDAVRFWIPISFFRNLKVEKITEQMRLFKSRNPNKEIVVVAHSFGSYLITKFIERNLDFKIDRLLLCGSILPEDFHWDKLPNFPEKGILNDIGTRDIWPLLAKSSTFGYGASGVKGFDTFTVENRYFNFGHSGFFSDDIFEKYWIPFLLDGVIVDSEHTSERKGLSWWRSIISIIPGGIFIILASVIASLTSLLVDF